MKYFKGHPSENIFLIKSMQKTMLFPLFFITNSWKILLIIDFLLMGRASLTLLGTVGSPHRANR